MRWEAFAALALLLAAAPVAAAGYVHDDRDLDEALAETENQPGHPYHTWETLTVDLQRLVNENPDIARLHSAGESVLGLDLWVVEIADFGDEDRRPLDERETVWLDGGTHANEQLGMELAYEWVEFLLDGYGDDETATWIVENRHTYIMPLVNPDGNHLDSRTNARGVDMNRNYPVGWGALDENRPPVGPGSYPASEPEVQTVLEWWDETEPDYVNSFHSGIDLMLYPPGYEEAKPADQQVYRRICEEIGEPDPEFCGPIYSTIYPAAGGSIDTSYQRHGSISFAYEVSTEQNMYASVEDPRDRLQRYWEGVEHAFLNVEKYGAHPTIEDVAIQGDQVELTVHNDGYGNLTHADVTLEADGEPIAEGMVGELAAGESTSLAIDADAQTDGQARLSAELSYPERQQASPIETRTLPLPVNVSGDQLETAPLTEEATDTVDEAVSAASVDEESETNGVPGVGALWASALLAALAVMVSSQPRRT